MCSYIVSPGLAAALDHTKVSDRKTAFVLSETVKSIGLDATEYNIKRSSISEVDRETEQNLQR